MVAVAESAIAAHTELLNDTLGIETDHAGGAAFGALVEALRRGDVAPGARVVLVVSGSAPSPEPVNPVHMIEPDARAVLSALGLDS